MKTVLHILTRPADELAARTIDRQRAAGEVRVVVVDLTAPAPDYDGLLTSIFAADTVAAW